MAANTVPEFTWELPVKEGKTFKGWKPEVTAAVADASYTAVYEETTPGGTGAVYTVTFDADNGTEVTAYKVAAGKTVEEPKEKPVKEGFTFKGWFKVPDPATAQTTPAAGAETGQEETLYDFTAPVNSDLKLKAHWEANAAPAPVQPAEQLMSSEEAEKMILGMTNDGDPRGSTFFKLCARQKSAGKKNITITWNRIPGTAYYTIFASRCGTKIKKVATVKGSKNTFTYKKLKPGRYYKFYVIANGGGKALAVSRAIHIATTGGRIGNVTKLNVKPKKLRLKVGKTKKIKVKAARQTGIVRNHRKNLFESSNTSVAIVNKKGKVKAIGKGSCDIYCFAQNGIYKIVKVVVK